MLDECSERIVVKLEPGWAFVETEDWEPDFLARWAPCGADKGAFPSLFRLFVSWDFTFRLMFIIIR